MRALVTGGAGFIGSRLAHRLLETGHEVMVADNLSGGFRRNVPEDALFFPVDLTNPDQVDHLWLYRPDVVFHFAAYAPQGYSPWIRRYCYNQNLLPTINLINSSLRHGIGRFVYASSMGVYGSQPPPFTEALPPAPEDPYAIAKRASELDLEAAGGSHDLDWTIIRPHNVYGVGQNLGDRHRNVIGIFLRQALAGEPLTVYNTGMQTRAYSYVDDILDPIIDAAVLPEANRQVYNIGGDTVYTIHDLIEHLGAHFPDLRWRFAGARPEAQNAWSEHTKAKDLLGFNPTTTLTAGLAAMTTWARTIDIRFTRAPVPEITTGLPHYWKED